MPFYLKKPIPIEARQITMDNLIELMDWSHGSVVKHLDGTPSGMLVYTLEGCMTASMGDYLVKGVRDEFYFCNKQIFEESYTEVEMSER
jgi:hypothetical protein